MKGDKMWTKCVICKEACQFDHRPYLNRLEVDREGGEKIYLTIQVSIGHGDAEVDMLNKEIVCEKCVEKLVIQGVSA